LTDVDVLTSYRTGSEDPVAQLLLPSFSHSVAYDRASGYFRSSVLSLISESLPDFIRAGGMIRLVCSPSLSAADVQILSGEVTDAAEITTEILTSSVARDIASLLESNELATCTRVLATLVRFGFLKIKFAVRPAGDGLYHEKIGIFSDDGGNAISFIGSANETWSGWSPYGNYESIEAFASWHAGSDAKRISGHREHFERLWNGIEAGVSTYSLPEAIEAKLLEVSFDDIDAAFEDGNLRLSAARQLRDHQQEALDAWEAAGRRGILAHATGSGKTFTAITAIARHLDAGSPAVVVVPSQLLLAQWESELRAEIPHAVILLGGGGHTSWRRPGKLRAMTTRNPEMPPRIVLATMQTASSAEFRGLVADGEHLLLVADEVHQLGSPTHRALLDLNPGARLGLSATPQRYGDPDGTSSIMEFFGGIVHTVNLAQAVGRGLLVPYEYFPHSVYLDDEEAQQWADLSRAIGRALSSADDKRGVTSELAKRLLIRRARIAKKATNKTEVAVQILRKNFEAGQSWLVYCEDLDQLKTVRAALDEAGLRSLQYHSNMSGSPLETLRLFASEGGILVSIRCLDEGVDIPRVDHALILASSQNPRQYIQRRGRVLRHAIAKDIARLHDVLVCVDSIERQPSQTQLVKTELNRALEFAESSVGRAAVSKLELMAIEMGVELDGREDTDMESE
jgi:superfamily II DNA or RNA helicase